MTVDRGTFLQAMRRFPGAANIIATGEGGERAGFTATACISLTAEPPQVGVAINRTVTAYPKLMANSTFCINTLAAGQHALATRFSGPVKGAERFEQGEWGRLVTGAPALDGAVVNLDCEIAECLELSTHTFVVGRVVAARQRAELQSLLYVDNDWASLLPGTANDVSSLLDGIHGVSMAIDVVMKSDADVLAKLDRFVKDWTRIYVQQRTVAQKEVGAELYVSPADLQKLNGARREFDDRLTALLEEGARSGCMDVDHARLTAFAIAGVVGWTRRWYRTDGPMSADEVGEHLAVLVRRMVERTNAAAPVEQEDFDEHKE